MRWAKVEKPGLPLLVRPHPLTIEGENIGTFELSLTCGETASSYSVTYVERRKPRDPKVEAVTKVVLFIGESGLSSAWCRPPGRRRRAIS